MFSFRKTVLGIEKPVVAGELSFGATAPELERKNALSAIYKIATDFVLLIKYSF